MHKIKNIEKVEYRRGMLGNGMNPESLPVKAWIGANISAEVKEAIKEEELLDLGGVNGDPSTGDPVEYDHLKIVLAGDTVEITVFNRGITLFVSDDERIRRIHRVLCKLAELGKG